VEKFEISVAGVEAEIARLRDLAWDDEQAHSIEDSIRAAVLAAIAAGHPDTVELAKLALSTKDIEFHRWCA